MLDGGMKEQKEMKINLTQYSRPLVRLALGFFYDGCVEWADETITDWEQGVEFLSLAHYLEIEELEGIAVEQLVDKITSQNVLSILKLAETLGGILPQKPISVGAKRCRWNNPMPADILRMCAIKFIENHATEVALTFLPTIPIPGSKHT
jgi:hypothetical protein